MTAIQVPAPDNSEGMTRFRKSRDTLINVGRGNLLLCAWSAVKYLGRVIMVAPRELENILESATSQEVVVTKGQLILLMIIMLAIVVIVTSLPRAIVSLSAIAEGRGKRRGILYLILSAGLIFYGIMEILTLIIQLLPLQKEDLVLDVTIATLIIDVTSVVLLVEMLRAVFQVRKYRRSENSREAQKG